MDKIFSAKLERELEIVYQEEWRYKRKWAVLHTLWQWGRKEDDYGYGILFRIFHSLKAIICVFLNRRVSLWGNIKIPDVEITVFDESEMAGECGTHYGWTSLLVGYGILDNWCYDIIDDGCP